MQARHPQFDTLQNVEDSRMHYAIEDITNATFLRIILLYISSFVLFGF